MVSFSFGDNARISGSISVRVDSNACCKIPAVAPELIRYHVADPVSSYEGRTEIFDDIKQALKSAGSEVVSKTIVFTGKEGIGKTEAANRFIKYYLENPEGNIVVLNCESTSALNGNIQELARIYLKKTIVDFEEELDSIIREVHAAIFARDSILVFNNAESFLDEPGTGGKDGIARYFPKAVNPPHKQPVIIITTRKTSGWDAGMITRELPVLKLEECEQFICKQLKNVGDVKERWRDLVIYCEQFPDALQNAVAKIKLQLALDTEFTIAHFLHSHPRVV